MSKDRTRLGLPSTALVTAGLASAAAFASIVLGLLLAPGVQLSWSVGLAAGAGIALPGGLVYLQVKDLAQDRRHTQAEFDKLSEELHASGEVIAELHEQLGKQKVERVAAAESLGALAEAFARYTSASPGEASSLPALEAKVLETLGETLAGADRRFLWPLRIAYLESPDETRSNGQAVLLRLQPASAWGASTDISWSISDAPDGDAKVAKDILQRLAPYKEGLLIKDVEEPAYKGMQWLRAPESSSDGPVRSYCRVAVALPDRSWGILCVDTWKETGLSETDKKIVDAFSYILAAVRAAATSQIGRTSLTPSPEQKTIGTELGGGESSGA